MGLQRWSIIKLRDKTNSVLNFKIQKNVAFVLKISKKINKTNTPTTAIANDHKESIYKTLFWYSPPLDTNTVCLIDYTGNCFLLKHLTSDSAGVSFHPWNIQLLLGAQNKGHGKISKSAESLRTHSSTWPFLQLATTQIDAFNAFSGH